jgi:hypothetical protein
MNLVMHLKNAGGLPTVALKVVIHPSYRGLRADHSMTSALLRTPGFGSASIGIHGYCTAREKQLQISLTPSFSQSQHSIQNAPPLPPSLHPPQTPPSLLHLPPFPLNKRPRHPRPPHWANPYPLPQPSLRTKRNLTATTPRTTR